MALGMALALGLGCSPLAEAEPPALEPQAFAIAPFPMADQARYGALTFAGGLFLSTPGTTLFGGVSGIEAETAADGRSVAFAGVTDQGYFLTFTGDLDEGNRLVGAGGLIMAPLRDTQGRVLAGKQGQDAEDISKPPDADGWLVSFERRHRILAYADPLDPYADVIGLNVPAEAKTLPANRGIEAIAALPGGTIAVGAEDGRMWLCPPRQEPCPRVHDKGGVGAFFYLTGLRGGFGSIIARVSLVGGKAVVTELTRLPSIVGNVEGISAVVGPAGGYRLYIVTDNNFDDRTATRLLAFDWKP
jgi:hypothetical protein